MNTSLIPASAISTHIMLRDGKSIDPAKLFSVITSDKSGAKRVAYKTKQQLRKELGLTGSQAEFVLGTFKHGAAVEMAKHITGLAADPHSVLKLCRANKTGDLTVGFGTSSKDIVEKNSRTSGSKPAKSNTVDFAAMTAGMTLSAEQKAAMVANLQKTGVRVLNA